VSTTGTGFFSAGAYAADLVPGFNVRLIQIELTLLSGGATGMDIGPLALSQTVRRSH
jgi:hypothetical protein